MPLGDSYATLAELRSRVGITDATNTTEDAKLTAALAAASRGIEKLCNRQFNLASGATARIYYPDSYMRTTVDDFTSATSVKTDESNSGVYSITWATTDYQLEPLNGVGDKEGCKHDPARPAGPTGISGRSGTGRSRACG